MGLYGVIFQHDPHALALSRFLVEDEVFTWRRKCEFFETVSRPIAGAIPTLTPCPKTPQSKRLRRSLQWTRLYRDPNGRWPGQLLPD